VSTASRIWLSLAGFLLIAGAVYGLTSHEYAGAPLLLVGGATFSYLALVGRSAAGRAHRDGEPVEEGEEGEEAGLPVAPSIWPFAFSVAGVIIALGLIVSPWILLVGVPTLAVSAGGWLRDIARGHPGTDRSR
jgi:hypothetical protein